MKLENAGQIQPETWDTLIAPFKNRLLFHHSAWLNFLQETYGVTPVHFKIVDGQKLQGYFVAFVAKKLFFTLLGSPLTGWETDFMGPIFNEGFDFDRFLLAIDDWAREQGMDFVQLGHPALPPSVMRNHGYRVQEWETFVVPICSEERTMWSNLSGKCRNRIRKGLKNGLEIEEDNDPAFVEEYYSQVKEVFGRQNLKPRYSIGLVKNLYRNLKPHNLVFTLRVKYGQKTIATGFFPHDEHLLFSTGIASLGRYRYLCPNELLYWSVMTRAGRMGIQRFYLGGNYRIPPRGGIFKAKFNARLELYYRYFKTFGPAARLGHALYRTMYYFKQRLARNFTNPVLKATSRICENRSASRFKG